MQHIICLLIDSINLLIVFIHKGKVGFCEQIPYICVVNSTASYCWVITNLKYINYG